MSLEHSPARQKRTGHRSAFCIDEFCERNSISRSFFYKLKKLGLGPRIMELAGKQLITETAERDWQSEREAA